VAVELVEQVHTHTAQQAVVIQFLTQLHQVVVVLVVINNPP
jgi:hypothetical protein